MASLGASADPLRAACAALQSLAARLLRGRRQPASRGLLALVVILCSAGISTDSAGARVPSCASEVPPSEQWGELFQQVQLKRIFPDSKTFADLLPNDAPHAILAEYEARKDQDGRFYQRVVFRV
jgi:alpha,alpha-trehalase